MSSKAERAALLFSVVLYAVGAALTPAWWLLRLLPRGSEAAHGVLWSIVSYAALAPLASPFTFSILASRVADPLCLGVGVVFAAVLVPVLIAYIKPRTLRALYVASTAAVALAASHAPQARYGYLLLTAAFSAVYTGFAVYASCELLENSLAARRLVALHYFVFGLLQEAAIALVKGLWSALGPAQLLFLLTNVVMARLLAS